MVNESPFSGQQFGNYTVTTELGIGAFGRVCRGQHLFLSERIVAIKLLHAAYLGSQQERESFINEAQHLEKLKHTSILPILDVGIHDGMPYIVTEYAPNGSLRQRLIQQVGKPLPLAEALRILTQIGQALVYAHQHNIIHRDLKPENILFNSEGNVLLADFGIAVVLSTSSMRQIDHTGTPAYMAPEQFRGLVSKACDQYALGCLAYELLTGQKPFNAPDFISMGFLHATEPPVAPTRYNPQIPLHIEQAVLKALAKRREDRYTDISEFITAIQPPATADEYAPTVLVPAQQIKKQLFEQGNVQIKMHQFSEALISFDNIMQFDANDALVHICRGRALFRLNRYDEALVAFEFALQLQPTFAEAYCWQGKTLDYLNRLEDTLKACSKALEYDATSIEIHIVMASAFGGLGQEAELQVAAQQALNAAERALQKAPDNFYLHRMKGRALNFLEHHTEAIVSFEQAFQLNPHDAEAYNWKGRTLYDLKRYEEALTFFARALQLDPNYLYAYINKGWSLYELKLYGEALTCANQALLLFSSCEEAYNLRGLVLSRIERYEEALVSYNRAIELSPTEAIHYNNKGNTLYKLKRYQEALAMFERASQRTPMNADYHYNRGIALENLKRYEEALAAYEQAKKLDPNYTKTYNEMLELVSMSNTPAEPASNVQTGQLSDRNRFDRFTERARKVLSLAQEEAQRFQHNYIGTEHLLLGLVREGEGVAAKVLANLGVELNKVRSAVEFIIGRGDRIVLGEVGLTPRAKKVIELAVDEARRLNHHYIGTEHLLLGLVREGEGIAAGVLDSLGVNLEKVRTQTVQVLSQSGAPSSTLDPTIAQLKDAMKELEQVLKEKEQAIQQQEYELAVELRDREVKIRARIAQLEKGWRRE